MQISMELKRQKWGVLFLAFALSVSGCKKDDFGPQSNQPNQSQKVTGVVVLNEGTFTWSNASLSVVNLENQTVNNNVFQQANNLPLGDVAQSAKRVGDEILVVVNNSNKIVRVNAENFTLNGSIEGLQSPRYMEFTNSDSNEIWVTDLFANQIHVVDLNTNAVSGAILVSGWCENIERFDNKMWVLNKKDSVIQVYHSQNQQLVSSLLSNDKVIDFKRMASHEVLVYGKKGIYKVNTNSLAIESIHAFGTIKTGGKIAYDSINKKVYLLSKNLEMLDLANPSQWEVILTPNAGQQFYGLATHPQNGNVFVTDAKDYVQNGVLIQWDVLTKETTEYGVGIAPQYILFN